MSSTPIPIEARVTSNPQVCVFTVGHPIFPGNSFNCATPHMAKGSPLLESLFEIPGVRQVLAAGNVLTVEKSSAEPWPELAKKIGAAVREKIRAGGPLVAPESRRSGLEEHIRRAVKEVLEREINPSLAGHGGRADVADVRGTEVHVRFSGGCQGCGASQTTLKQGIEGTVLREVPEVTRVLDATDHAAGDKPYYPAGTGQSPFV